jgi:DNA processing protein
VDAIDLQLLLGRTPGLSAQRLRAALEHLGAGELAALRRETRSRLEAAGLSPAAAASWQTPPMRQIAQDRASAERSGLTLVDATSPRYPPRLAATGDAPALLYVRGSIDSLAALQLAMVGSRNPTPLGVRTAREFAQCFAQAGLTITSGLALGIDAASHEGTLAAGGRTVAVAGCGLDRVYPPQHAALAERIAAAGALVSEYPPGTPALRGHFPRRNRIISGLCVGVLVIEAAIYSGSLSTARLALALGREVFAIPGSIHNPLAHGCNALIRAGAKLVESGPQVLEELKLLVGNQSLTMDISVARPAPLAPESLDKDFKILLDALGFEATSVDELVGRTGLPSQSVASMLLILELEGSVGMQAGGRYLRL